MIRKGKIDLTILGALEVSESGDLANWIVPGKKVPGMGGAMELSSRAKKVIVTMNHCDKNGVSKIVKECRLPLTSKTCVQMVITEMGVFTIDKGKLYLNEIFSPYTLESIQAITDASFVVSEHVKVV
jgi:acetate CoA/acetoacetate CoA-transferase beta subunit